MEIWQTDMDGTYNHPGDSTADDLLDDFQYFGTATTDEEGYYAFMTVKPGQYEPRPVHIHFKVKIDGETVLTSQFYFAEDFDGETAPDASTDTIMLSVEDTEDANGDVLRIAEKNIVLDLNGSDDNTLEATEAQQEGPYYPVVDFADYDNNLLNAETDEEPVLPMLDSDMMASTPFTLLNLNSASGDDFLTIPGMNSRMVREFNEYRPYISILQFRREIGKYVSEDVVAGYEEYVYVPVEFNASDAATLMQIDGLEQAIADALIAARPFADVEAFLTALTELAPNVDVTYASHFLAGE